MKQAEMNSKGDGKMSGSEQKIDANCQKNVE